MNAFLEILVCTAFMVTPIVLLLILLILNKASDTIKGIRKDQVDFQNWVMARLDNSVTEVIEPIESDEEIANRVERAIRLSVDNHLNASDDVDFQSLEDIHESIPAEPMPYKALSPEEVDAAFNTDDTCGDDVLEEDVEFEVEMPDNYDYLMDMGSEHEYDRGTYHTLRSYCACFLSRTGESMNDLGVKRFVMSAYHEECLRLLSYAKLKDGCQPLSVSAIVNNILNDHFNYFRDEMNLLIDRGRENLEKLGNDRY